MLLKGSGEVGALLPAAETSVTHNLLTFPLSALPSPYCRFCFQGNPKGFSQFSHSVVFNSLRPHGLQHSGLSCPAPTPRIYSNSCPSSQWCHPAISSSVVPFSSCFQSFPASGSFPKSQFFTSSGQSIGTLALASISPSSEYSGLISFRMDWLDLPAVQGTLKSLLQQHNLKASILQCSTFFMVQLFHPYMTTGKTIALTRMDLCWQSNVSAF